MSNQERQSDEDQQRADLWRIPQEHLEEAQDAATLAAIKEMEKAGVDIISDGEIRRESYSNRFATSLAGLELSTPGQITGSGGSGISPKST